MDLSNKEENNKVYQNSSNYSNRHQTKNKVKRSFNEENQIDFKDSNQGNLNQNENINYKRSNQNKENYNNDDLGYAYEENYGNKNYYNNDYNKKTGNKQKPYINKKRSYHSYNEPEQLFDNLQKTKEDEKLQNKETIVKQISENKVIIKTNKTSLNDIFN